MSEDEKPNGAAAMVLAEAQEVAKDIYGDSVKGVVQEAGILSTRIFRATTAPLRALLFGSEWLERQLGERIKPR